MMAGFARHAAAAWVHSSNPLDLGRIGNAMVGTGDDAFARFQRLPQGIEDLRREFGKLVEKKHAVMGEGNFAGSRADPAAYHGRHGGGVVRGMEGPAVGQLAAQELAGDRCDHRDVQQFARQKWRKNRGEPLRQHGLARSRRADHQQIVTAGRRNLKCTAGAFLPPDIGEVGKACGARLHRGFGAGKDLRAAEVIVEGDKAARGKNVDLPSGPGGLRATGCRTYQARS